MSQNDSFIDEVTEEVRRDRLFALFRRYGWIGILLVLVIVAGAAWSEWRKARDAARAQAFGDAVLTAMEAATPEARAAALATVEADAGRAAVLAFLASAETLAAGDRAGALARLDALAADGALPESYRHLAQFKRLLIAGAEMPAADRAATLEALARPGAPYRMLALEQQALALAAGGKAAEAAAALHALLQEPGVTAGLRQRATRLIVALGEEPPAG